MAPPEKYPGLKQAIKSRYRKEGAAPLVAEFGCSRDVIDWYVKKFGLSRLRFNWERLEKRLPKEVLEREYQENLLSDRQIMVKYQMKRHHVLGLRAKYGISPLSKTERVNKRVPAQIVPEEVEEFILGTLLGKATLRRSRSGVPYFVCHHPLQETGYALKKRDILGEFFSAKYQQMHTIRNGSSYLTGRVTSEASPYWQKWWDLLYPEGKKVWPIDGASRVTPGVLVSWFADSGRTSRKGHASWTSKLLLNFPDEADKLIKKLSSWGVQALHSIPAGMRVRKFLVKGPKSLENFQEILASEALMQPRQQIFTQFPTFINPESADHSQSEALKALKTGGLSKEATVRSLLSVYRVAGFPYPKYSEKQISRTLDQIQRVQPSQVRKEDRTWQYLNTGVNLCTSFHPHIWGVRINSRKITTLGAFQDSQILEKVLTRLVESGKGLEPKHLLQALKYEKKTVGNFPPAVAKTFCDLFFQEPGHVLDFSAGFGGRMVGCWASEKVLSYTGLDPSEKTLMGNQTLRQTLQKKVDKPIFLHLIGAENWSPPQGLEYDLCFTSPPYFNYERYAEDKSQVCVFCQSIEDYERWIAKVFEMLQRVMKPGAIIGIQVGNPRRAPAAESWKRVAPWPLKEDIPYRIPSRFSKSGNWYESILVYQVPR